MCGIWFYLSKKIITDADFSRLVSSFMKIKMRGPDRSTLEFFYEPVNMAIGFHRLSIMDPSVKGDQPFKLEKGDGNTIYVICNGEIYNHRELAESHGIHLTSHSDCEIIPHIYKTHGVEYLAHVLNGEYAIIIIDVNLKTGERKIYAFRDRFGVRPMFLSFDNERESLCFCSEMKGLVGVGTPEWHVNAVEPRWIYEVMQDGEIKQKPYYNVSSRLPEFITDIDEAKSRVRASLSQAIEKRLISDRPLGCLLSGGLDSSLVAAYAAHILSQKGQRLRTFSIGLEGSTDEKYARMVAHYINSIHTHVQLETEDFINALKDVIKTIESYDITTVRASTGQYLLSKYISENTDIKVLLIGDGSDELCSGYKYFHRAPSPLEMHEENIRLLKDIHYYDVLRADRGIAENGIEARVPFLDHEFVETYLSIDPELRMPKTVGEIKMEKWLLRESFNISLLPTEVLFRSKEAFSDGVSSLKKSWYQIIQEYADTKYTDEYLLEKQTEYTHLPPPTKEALYFREIYESYYGRNTEEVIPYFWLPKWMGDIREPSARVLPTY